VCIIFFDLPPKSAKGHCISNNVVSLFMLSLKLKVTAMLREVIEREVKGNAQDEGFVDQLFPGRLWLLESQN